MGERALSLLACKYVDDVVIDATATPTEEMLAAMNVAVVVRCEGHADFDALTAATDWEAVEAVGGVEVRTLAMASNDFCSDTILRRVSAKSGISDGPSTPSSLVPLLPVSRYLLEPASGAWVLLECGVLTSREA